MYIIINHNGVGVQLFNDSGIFDPGETVTVAFLYLSSRICVVCNAVHASCMVSELELVASPCFNR